MLAVRFVVGVRRHDLERVGAEDDQIEQVAAPLRRIPAAVGVGLGPVRELVPAQRIARRGRQRQLRQQGAVATQPQGAQQAPHAEQHAALVVAGNRDRDAAPGPARGRPGPQAVAVGAGRERRRAREISVAVGGFKDDCGAGVVRRRTGEQAPGQVAAPPHLLHQESGGTLQARAGVRRQHHARVAEVQQPGGWCAAAQTELTIHAGQQWEAPFTQSSSGRLALESSVLDYRSTCSSLPGARTRRWRRQPAGVRGVCSACRSFRCSWLQSSLPAVEEWLPSRRTSRPLCRLTSPSCSGSSATATPLRYGSSSKAVRRTRSSRILTSTSAATLFTRRYSGSHGS